MSTSDLWKAYKYNNDREAKDQLIIQNVELVKIIAGRLYVSYNQNVDYDDLVGYGIIGLMDAIEKFDITKNIKFSTYANIRIRGAIVDQMRSLDWIPRTTRQKYKNIESAMEKLQNVYGVNVSDELLADELGISVAELHKDLGEVSNLAITSLDNSMYENGTIDVVSKSVEMSPESSLDEKEMTRELQDAIDILPDKERTVISLYYYEELTYREISEIMGISESRISQIHSKAITKLKLRIKSF